MFNKLKFKELFDVINLPDLNQISDFQLVKYKWSSKLNDLTYVSGITEIKIIVYVKKEMILILIQIV